jgi:small subunit ribosomal protein S2
MAKKIDIEELFNAGAHFGHKASKWNPKMKSYIHSTRRGNHIINLERTVENLEAAVEMVKAKVKAGGEVLFVATKTQLKGPVKSAAEECGAGYVVERWPGGLLTNKATMSARIKRLRMLETKMDNGDFAKIHSKLELQRIQEEIDSLNKQFGGIKDMAGDPAVVIVFDGMTNTLATKEGIKIRAKVVTVCDSNVDPTGIDHVIPANDDATEAITLIAEYFKDAVTAGKEAREK